MPFCPNCGTNLNDDFRFCPHCGRPISTTGSQIVQRSDDPRLYEEATLRLRFTIEYQVLYSGKGMFGNYTERGYVQVGYIDLMAMSHTRGEYVALTSDQFKGLQRTPDLDPSIRYGEEWTSINDIIEQGMQLPSGLRSVMFAEIIQERKTSWNNFCILLSKEGWFGIADDAVRCENPLVNPMLEWSKGVPYSGRNPHSDWYKKYRKEDPSHIFYYPLDSKNYRYRRQV